MTGVLVTGGTGKIGRELVKLLRANGVPVRVGSRTPAAGDPDAVRFDWDDLATHPAALAGQDRVFLVPPTQSADPLPAVVPFLGRAQSLGVRQVVLLGSAIPLAPTAQELAAHVRAQPGGVVLRASGFMQNFLSPHPLGERIRRTGQIRTAAGDGRVAWIDARDIAATAAAILMSDLAVARDERDHLLTGPEALSYPQAAAIITTRTGRQVRVVHVSADEQAADLRAAGIPPAFATILATADAGVRPGQEDRLSTAVLDLTGRPPRTFAQFVREHAARWTTPTV
ncbi:NAD(P)H-binding protein [Amycolatopsis solani]|uniref:NAD(P)H-binding protein n=1 Tax=Amycolatopsis solani TaxID=3028615 RepID=UPI0025B08F74|nr:NAD(P)H-binding protein [Amycolatopsis sp. MEP2-6]